MILRLSSKEFFHSSQQPLAIEPRSPQDNFPEHIHNFNELIIINKGRGRHILNDYPFELHQGMMLYIESQDRHLYENVEGLHLTNILVQSYNNFKFIHNIELMLKEFKPKQGHCVLVNNKTLSESIKLIENCSLSSVGMPLEADFFQLLRLLQSNAFNDKGTGNNEDKISQLLIWLKHHFSEEINWEQVAEQFDLSLRTLHRCFKLKTNLSPQAFLIKLRLAHAYHQIRYTNKAIIDIAYESGFNDSCYFSTCFKNEFKFCPRHLRDM